ncbi:hypothetical protein EWH08_18665 [Sphingobium indicum]|uniref:Uncharacterized protein n=3 Tax=Alphaproteobacteria TaxID=28211 RepID=A0A4Q4IVL1_9SPHN|nr:hypothetical protein [Sphingobium indicum]EJU10112.1 hypothetical protein LH128_25603 [Sphingomonas sp. LH128]RYL97464.1 hypothetical protein EWH08_18665 [Sphingobium indicum]BBF72523.1 hypothetical protein SBA_pBAR3_0900 [Sphingomonas bisphenolicum]
MSRHRLAPRPECPKVLCAVVGFDRPLQTLFAQVFSRIPEADDPEAESVRHDNEDGDEDGEILLWAGTEPGELLDPQAAIALVAPYALIPDDLAARLRADMDAAAGKRDGAHQIEVKRILFGSQH